MSKRLRCPVCRGDGRVYKFGWPIRYIASHRPENARGDICTFCKGKKEVTEERVAAFQLVFGADTQTYPLNETSVLSLTVDLTIADIL